MNIVMIITVLSLLVGISSCTYPGRGWREHEYEGAHGNQPGRQIGVRGNQSKRDCVTYDGHRYCREGT